MLPVLRLYALLALCCLAPIVPAAPGSQPASGRLAPLFDDLGDYRMTITTSAAEAARYFNQGLMLSYGFNHAEALRSFAAAQQLDPSCAMCFWGEAYALGPNINKPMDPADNARAYAAAQAGLRLATGVSARERALLEAMAARYAATPGDDRRDQDRAFANAMYSVVTRFPDDQDARTVYADAMMNLTPWNYYRADGSSRPVTNTIIAALESVLADNPDHPGAIHLYIHAVEASSTPERAESAADRLGRLVPGSGHLVHMPSHIYLRVGRYHDATVANERAAAADESYITQCRVQGFYPALYYPHNLHFLWYTASLEGRSAVAIPAAQKLADNVPLGLISDVPLIEQFLAVPMFSDVQFRRWQAILERPRPAPEHGFATAMWHATRGIALAETGQVEAARGAQRDFATAGGVFGTDSLAAIGYPADLLIRIADGLLLGAVSNASGDPAGAEAALREAIRIEDNLPYMEPPYWFFPVRHVLGRMLLQHGHYAKAAAVYEADLEHHPRNGWALGGLLTARQKTAAAADLARLRTEFERAWSRADVTP